MNLTAPGAVAALQSAFLEMLREGPSDIAAFERAPSAWRAGAPPRRWASPWRTGTAS